MNNFLRKLIPNSLRNQLNIFRTFLFRFELFKRFNYYLLQRYDRIRFLKHSAVFRGDHDNQETLKSAILMEAHKIEKGLSLPDIRLKFGLSFIPKLIENTILYKKRFGNDFVVASVYKAIYEYRSFHLSQGIHIKEIDDSWEQLKMESTTDLNLATITIIKESIYTKTDSFDFKSFTACRHSVRNFSEKMVDPLLIENAIDASLKTPSVCNRQPWKAYLAQGPIVSNILKLQNGNESFRSTINTVLIVTASLSYMRSPYERHQIFIDGGMFSMSLIYSLHAQGLASCALNWCAPSENDERMHMLAHIPQEEEIIMLIAVGHYKESIKVAASPRKSINDALVKV